MSYLGVRAVNSTVYVCITTHAQTGASVAPSSALDLADFILYKNGSATQRTSTAGWTITSPFDSITGLHMLAIDLSDNTDAGFYASGAYYNLILSPDTETVDTLVVVREVASWDIGVVPANVTQWLGTAAATPATAGIPDVNVKNIDNDAASASGTVTFPNATLASTTNITAGTIATVTNLTNAPGAGDLTATMKTSVQTAADAAITASAVLALIASYIDTEVAAIKTQTDKIPASPAAVGSAMTLTSGERDSVADALLDRNMATGADSGSTTVRTVRQALRILRNKWSISGTTQTITKENDSTASWTQELTGTAGADPVTATDPAGP